MTYDEILREITEILSYHGVFEHTTVAKGVCDRLVACGAIQGKPKKRRAKKQPTNAPTKEQLVQQMCLFLGIGEGATPSNQVYNDPYFSRALTRSIKEAGYTWAEFECAARELAKRNSK